MLRPSKIAGILELRCSMKALRFGVQVRSVDDLTDEEYNVALHKTHEYYVKHPTFTHRDRISCGCGPADATKRFTEKAYDVGTPARFRV